MLNLKYLFRVFCKIILPKKLFFRWFMEEQLFYKNPLHRNQKFQYWQCGCGSGKKVKWCCGQPKFVPFRQFENLKAAMVVWEKYRNDKKWNNSHNI